MFLGCTLKLHSEPEFSLHGRVGIAPPHRPEPDTMDEVTRPVHFAATVLLDRGASRMVEDAGGTGWKQPVFRHPFRW